MPKLTVVLLFGGRSAEHAISCATAGGVLAALDRSSHDVIPVGITRDGAFTLQPDDADLFRLDPTAMPSVADNGTRVLWPSSASSRELRVTDASGSTRSLGKIDVVFPILHGRFGEDGTVQGLLELLGLPYVGAGVLASALAMDKPLAKTAFSAAGIPVSPGITVTGLEWATAPEAVASRIADWPVFVKPARAGSSVGVSKVSSPGELAPAMAAALAEDPRVLIESAMTGREIECGVLSGRDGGAPRVSLPGEIVVDGDGFYDYDAKYLDAPGVRLACPAALTADEFVVLQDLAARAFIAIGGAGLARADFFLTADGFVLNELNTMPGFTPISMFPKCWEATGMTYTELLDELIQLGLETAR